MYEECIKESKHIPDFSGTDDYDVYLTLHGDVQDARFLRFLEKVGRERMKSYTTKEFLALDLIHREQEIPDVLRDSLASLAEQGIIEKTAGRGKYILSRSLYAFLGQRGVYTRKRGLDHDTNKALLEKHIKDNDKSGSKLDELLQVLPHLTPRQVKYMLNELKNEGRAHVKGRTHGAKWHNGLPSN